MLDLDREDEPAEPIANVDPLSDLRQPPPKVGVQAEPAGEQSGCFFCRRRISTGSIWPDVDSVDVEYESRRCPVPASPMKAGAVGGGDGEQRAAAFLSDMENSPLTSHLIST